MLEDDELLEGDGGDHLRSAVRPSSNRFWIVAVAIGTVCAVTVVGIFANRPLVGSIARAEQELRTSRSLAEGVFAQSGTFSGAGPDALSQKDTSVTYLAGDVEATGQGQVSVYATATRWGAAVAARPGACFYIARTAGGLVRYGSGTTCSGRAALSAADDAW